MGAVAIAEIKLSSRASTADPDTMDLPITTAIAAGDLILLFHFTDGALTRTWGTGPVELKDTVVSGSVASIGVAYLIAAGGETTVTVTKSATERFSAIAVKILAANWHGTTPPQISVGVTGNSTTPDPDSLTVSWAAGEANGWIAIECDDDSLGTNGTTAYPLASNNQRATSVASAGGGAICFTQSTVDTLNPGTFTITTDQWWAGTLAIRPKAAGGSVTVIPGVLALALTTFVASVLTPVLATIAAAALTLTTFAPTITVSDNQLATPSIVALATTTFAPTITVSDNQLVTPGVVALTTTTFAPVVTATANQLVTPDVASLVVTTFAPTVATPSLVAPGTLDLVLSAFAPTVLTPRLITPEALSMSLATFIPSVEAAALSTWNIMGMGMKVAPGVAACGAAGRISQPSS